MKSLVPSQQMLGDECLHYHLPFMAAGGLGFSVLNVQHACFWCVGENEVIM